ncbi:MAG: peptidase S8, partial [Pseudomonadota bacterium]|nr:peptidase S8 [Pseudomonadota bacterium]
LNTPISYDYQTGAVGYEQRFLSLAPSGREIDYEVAYSVGAFGGDLGLNAFLRTDPGHVAAMPNDAGAAIRFTLGL